MEQRIRPNKPPVHAAGTDPAYIPGLTAARPAQAEQSAPRPPATQPSEEAPEPESPRETAAQSEAEPPAETGAEPAEPAESAEPAEPETEADADGPAFEARDRRGSITADRTGITFRLDDETAEFPWDEIGAVEISTPRLARRFTVTVYTTGHRRYDADVEAPDRGRPKVWASELEAVLDVYFDQAVEETASEDG